MSKEKLKKEAGNWLRKYLLCCNCEKKCNCIDSNSYCEEQVLKAYIDSAEPREKRIQEKDKKIAELEAQIEKMKCCYNCSKWYDGECEESPKSKTFFCADFKCDKWECEE